MLPLGKVLPLMDLGADTQADPQVSKGLHEHLCSSGEISALGQGKYCMLSSLFISAWLGVGNLSSSSPTASDSENV